VIEVSNDDGSTREPELDTVAQKPAKRDAALRTDPRPRFFGRSFVGIV